MIDKSELLRVPAFTDLPEEQIAWFLSQSQETHVKAGDTYVRQGDPADWMFVILEGQFQWRLAFGGVTTVSSLQPCCSLCSLSSLFSEELIVSVLALFSGAVLAETPV